MTSEPTAARPVHHRDGTAPPPLTVRTPEDVLALVPVLLGFRPSDSVVLLTTGGAPGFHARVDLPSHRSEIPALVSLLLDPVRRHRVEGVVIVVYSDAAALARSVCAALDRALQDAGIAVLEALRVTEDRYYPRPSPPASADRSAFLAEAETGVAYDVSTHPITLSATVDGSVTLDSRQALAATLATEPAAVASVEAHLVAAPTRGRAPQQREAREAEGEWVQRLLRAHRAARTTPEPCEVARLVSALQDVAIRDAAWCTLLPRAAASTSAAHRAEIELWSALVRATPPVLLAPVATLLGWAAWQAGHGALAWCAVDRAIDTDPGYRLAGLLADALEAAVPPGTWPTELDWRATLDVS